jgi:hypothetical protein
VKNERLAGKTLVSFALKHQVQSVLATWSAKEAFFQYPVMEIINEYVGREQPPTAVIKENEVVVSELDVYPNPATEKLTLNYKAKQSEQVAISIFDLTSRKVADFTDRSQIGINTLDINLPHLENGIYFLSVQTSKGRIGKKIVIQN